LSLEDEATTLHYLVMLGSNNSQMQHHIPEEENPEGMVV